MKYASHAPFKSQKSFRRLRGPSGKNPYGPALQPDYIFHGGNATSKSYRGYVRREKGRSSRSEKQRNRSSSVRLPTKKSYQSVKEKYEDFQMSGDERFHLESWNKQSHFRFEDSDASEEESFQKKKRRAKQEGRDDFYFDELIFPINPSESPSNYDPTTIEGQSQFIPAPSQKIKKLKIKAETPEDADSSLNPPAKEPEERGILHPTRAIYRWTILLLSSCILFASYMSDGTIGATAPLLQEKYNISATQIGLLWSVGYLPTFFMTMISGILVDKLGTQITSMIFVTFLFVGSTMFAVIPNYWGMLAGRIFFGLGNEPLDVVSDAVVTRWYWDSDNPSLALAYTVGFSMSQLGGFLSLNALPAIAEYHLEFAFGVSALFVFVGVLCSITYVVMDRRASRIYPEIDNPHEEDEGEFSFKHITKFPVEFWLVVIIGICSFSQVYVIQTFALTYVNEKWGYSLSNSGQISSIVYIIPFFGQPLVGYLLGNYGLYSLTLIVGSVVLVCGLILFATTSFNPVVALTFIGISFSLVPSALWPAVNEVIPTPMIGTAFGLITAFQSLALFGLPYAFGWVQEAFDSYEEPYLMLAIVAGVGTLACVLLAVVDVCKGGRLHYVEPWDQEDEEDEEEGEVELNTEDEKSRKSQKIFHGANMMIN